MFLSCSNTADIIMIQFQFYVTNGIFLPERHIFNSGLPVNLLAL